MEGTNETRRHEVAEIKIIYKSNVQASSRPKISHSKEACNILLENWDRNKLELPEQFKVMFTNRAQTALGICEVSTGWISGTVPDPKLIFATALKAAAHGMILVHYAK